MKHTATREEQVEYREFEQYVAYLYEELGFKVERNLNIGGQEADILASRYIAGVGEVRVIVECKWRADGSISNQEVADFHSVVTSLRSRQLITRGVMVTNRKFSQDALVIPQHANDLELLTVAQLENQLFDLRHAFRAYGSYYEGLTIFTSYIFLHATWQNIGDDKKSQTDNVEQLIDGWINDSSFSLLSILADYGSGKTTLLERVKYVFARRYLSGASQLIPIFIPLKLFWTYGNLDDFIRHILLVELEREIPLSAFWRILREGRFLVLLDGLDEMVAAVDEETRRDSFLLLAPLLNSRSKVIITCRPSYFISTSDHNKLVEAVNRQSLSFSLGPPGISQSSDRELLKMRLLSRVAGYEPLPTLDPSTTKVIHLSSLTEDQIDLFLERHDPAYKVNCDCSWQEVKRFLFDAYDLRDLMTRPILLTIINETVLAGKIGINSAIASMGPSSLYELYTSMKLDLDWRKGETRQLVSKADRALFAETLAVAMFQSGKLEISYSSLLDLAKQGLGLPIGLQHLEKLKPDVLASDLRICTFLTRTDEVFRFSHQSFLEFFVAFHLKKGLLNAGFEGNRFFSLVSMNIPKGVLYFLGGFAVSEPNVRQELLRRYYDRLDRQTDDSYARNLAGALLYSGPIQLGLRLEDILLSRIDLKKISFLDAQWNRVRFADSDWRDVRMTQSKIENFGLENCSLNMFTVDQTEIRAAMGNVFIRKTRFTESTLLISSRRLKLDESEVEECFLKIAGEAEINGTSFIGGELEAGGFGGGVAFNECTMFETTFLVRAGEMREVKLRNCDLVNCRVFGLRIQSADASTIRMKGCEGIIVLHEEASRKVAKSSSNIALAEEDVDKKMEISSRNSGIAFVSEEIWCDALQRKALIEGFKPRMTRDWERLAEKLIATAI